MAKALIPVSGAWRRHTRYEVIDGCIRPSSSAELIAYDPWAAPAEGGKRSTGPLRHPHNALLALLQHESALSGPDDDARRVAESAVTQWCEANGLLGVLHHRVTMVTIRNNVGDLTNYLRDGSESWAEIEDFPESDGTPALVYRRGVGGVEVPVEVESFATPAPSVLIHGLHGGAASRERLMTTWARFFPSVPYEQRESFAYPRPGTDAFWRLYAEPLQDFFDGVRALSSAIETFTVSKRTRLADVANVERLVAPVQPMLRVQRRGLTQGWRSPSLLGTLALRAVMVLVSGGHVGRCRACSQLFTSELPSTRYCCNRCRRRVNKRVERNNRKAKQR